MTFAYLDAGHCWDEPTFWPAMRERANDPKYIGTLLDRFDQDRKGAAGAVAVSMIMGVLDQLMQAMEQGHDPHNVKPMTGIPFPSRGLAEDVKKQVKRRFRKLINGGIRSHYDPSVSIKELKGVRGYDWHVVAFHLTPLYDIRRKRAEDDAANQGRSSDG